MLEHLWSCLQCTWQVNFMFLIYILGKMLHQSIAACQHFRSFTFLQKLATTSIRSPPSVIVLKSSTQLSLAINQTIATTWARLFMRKRGYHRKATLFYTLNLELVTPLPAILSTRRRPNGEPKKDRTTPPISVLQSGHTAFILSHLSTHWTWKKCVQGSSRSSSSSPYFVRQMQHTCINISRRYS